MPTLYDCRRENELDKEHSIIEVFDKKKDQGTVLVVLKRKQRIRDGKQPYSGYKYLSNGDGEWLCFKDLELVSAEDVIKWLAQNG